jgi:nucleotide-binding universal stress UspA family protein
MKRVLLTIDGMTPNQKAFDYAVSLCKRIKAELSIFQIINPRYHRKYMKKIRKNALLAKKIVEGAMVAATFAEAGERETALDIMNEASKQIEHLLQESEKAGIRCHFSITSGNPGQEIVEYVNGHRDVILTIYDVFGPVGPVDSFEKKSTLAKIKKDLSVPVVTVHG